MRLSVVLTVLAAALLASCGSSYRDLPFGGMNGRVQKVTIFHMMPEMWYAGNHGSDIMYINTSVYDVNGNEIYSAVQDSASRFVSQAESLFEDGVSVRSVQKAGTRTIARINLISKKKGILEYSKELNGHTSRMIVKKSSIGRRHKSVVTEDGKVAEIRIIKTDKQGYPQKIVTKEPQTGNRTVETNTFDEHHNVTEKHVVIRNGADGKEEERITRIKYGDLDDHGNWKDCRTYNEVNLPVEVLVREFEYWE
jgi:hypothetical protein